MFPEEGARASRALFADIRPGAGRWLASLAVPVVPVGVFRSDEGWRVAFGPPVRWSSRAELRDVQLGLAIASLLPPDLAPRWLPLLERWRAAHARPTWRERAKSGAQRQGHLNEGTHRRALRASELRKPWRSATAHGRMPSGKPG